MKVLFRLFPAHRLPSLSQKTLDVLPSVVASTIRNQNGFLDSLTPIYSDDGKLIECSRPRADATVVSINTYSPTQMMAPFKPEAGGPATHEGCNEYLGALMKSHEVVCGMEQDLDSLVYKDFGEPDQEYVSLENSTMAVGFAEIFTKSLEANRVAKQHPNSQALTDIPGMTTMGGQQYGSSSEIINRPHHGAQESVDANGGEDN